MKVFLIFISLLSSLYAQEIFGPQGEYIDRQVQFWKKIYTEYSISQTVIHDREEPSIIYGVVDHNNYLHHSRVKKVKKQLVEIRNQLKSIKNKKFNNLSQTERRLLEKIPTIYRKNILNRIKSVKYQQGMKEKFQDGVGRSYLYLEHIENILQEKGLPRELAYLPHVESSFNYKAYSKVGAAGIWQFMRSSGKHYGLKVEKYIDQRLDPIKASEAAARMLQDNFKILKTWPLAITAYNHGPYGLKKYIEKIGTRDFSTIVQKYKKKSFSFASKNFYASFIAAIEVAKNYRSHYLKIKDQATLGFESFETKKKRSVRSVMTELSLNKEIFKMYNPHIKLRAINLNIMLPKGTTIRFPERSQIAKENNKKIIKLASRS